MMNRLGAVFLILVLGVAIAGCSGLAAANPLSNGNASIATQPTSQTVTVGQAAAFAVAATGTAPLSYQWQKNNAAILGATSSSYTAQATTSSDNGTQFTVVVSNTIGSVTTNAATLTVNAAPGAPSLTPQPATQTVTTGPT